MKSAASLPPGANCTILLARNVRCGESSRRGRVFPHDAIKERRNQLRFDEQQISYYRKSFEIKAADSPALPTILSWLSRSS
jgi:hypothetical protein